MPWSRLHVQSCGSAHVSMGFSPHAPHHPWEATQASGLHHPLVFSCSETWNHIKLHQERSLICFGGGRSAGGHGLEREEAVSAALAAEGAWAAGREKGAGVSQHVLPH